MEQRNLTVYAGNGKNYASIPQIILQGQWLKRAGFEIGDKIRVECQNGRLIISKETPANMKAE